MSTYTQILYQIVFSTKSRYPTLEYPKVETLYRYIQGVLKEKNCVLYQIGGVEDHIHIITYLHPSIALADLVKDIKLSTSDYIKKNGVLPMFSGWQDGYGAFTYSQDAKKNLVRYVKNQRVHHKKVTFHDEYKGLLEEHGVPFDERYLL